MNLFEFIRSSVSIEDVVREYVALKPAGSYLKGFSPFKHERTPSFTVSPHRGIYYCFSTASGGDVIDFVSKMERCSQIEAARFLVERYHLKPPANLAWQESNDKNDAAREAYFAACAVFAAWAAEELTHNAEASHYLAQRAVLPSTMKQFSLGYCPAGGAAIERLLAYALARGVGQQVLLEAHILVSNMQGAACAFEERILFPIHDHLGRVCGFGGRTFRTGDERPKYYNSRDHQLFNKKQLVYGLNRAKKEIQASGSFFLVEGYLDCIAMVQAGYPTTVATLGTACTAEHLALLRRYGKRVVVLYDGDVAGQKAVLRLAHLCWESNLDMAVLTLPEHEDPASYLAQAGSIDALGEEKDIFTFFIESVRKNEADVGVGERRDAVQQVLDLISQVTDPLRRQLLLQRASTTFDLPMNLLTGGVRSGLRRPGHPASAKETVQNQTHIDPLEKRLFSVILQLGVMLDEEKRSFLQLHLSEPLRGVFVHWCACNGEFQRFYEELDAESSDLVSQLMVMHDEKAPGTDGLSVFEQLFAMFSQRKWRDRVKALKERLVKAELDKDPVEKREILAELQAIRAQMMVRRGV